MSAEDAVQGAISAVVWDLFPTIAPYVPSAPLASGAIVVGPTPRPRLRQPMDPAALRCCYATRGGRIVYRGRRVGSTQVTTLYWSTDRVLRHGGLYLELARRKMEKSGESMFPEALRAATQASATTTAL